MANVTQFLSANRLQVKEGIVPEWFSLDRILYKMQSDIFALSGRGTGGVLFGGPINAGANRIFGIVNTVTPTNDEVVSYGLAQSLYAPKVMQSALSALGLNPLNVQNLPGLLRDPQNAGIQVVAALPSQSLSSANLVVIYQNTLYRFDATTFPGKWKQITTTGIIPSGTRGAIPAASIAGVPYIETDLNALYLDNGTNYVLRLGFAIGTDATRTGLVVGANDNGLPFFVTDTNILWAVQAGAWSKLLISLTGGVTGILPVANGGSGAGAFTQGSVVFAGASGVYTQDNANLFWDGTNHRLGLGTVSPNVQLDQTGAHATRRFGVALANGANNDIAISTTGYMGITGPTAGFSISGFANGFDGRILRVTSEVAQVMTISNLAGSAAANQIITGTGADVVLSAIQGVTVQFIYNGTLSRWCLVRSI